MEAVLLWEAGISEHSMCGCCLQNLSAPRDFTKGKAQQNCGDHIQTRRGLFSTIGHQHRDDVLEAREWWNTLPLVPALTPPNRVVTTP